MRPPLARTGIALFLMAALLASPVRGASAPYFDNFDSYPDGSPPVNFEPAGGSWYVFNGRYFSSLQSMQPRQAYSEISLGNVAGQSFTISTRFSGAMISHGPAEASAGLIALSSSAPGVFPADGYTLEYFVASEIGREGTFGASGGGVSWSGGFLFRLFDLGQGLLMSLHGEYVGGSLSLTATLGNGLNAITLHGVDETPLSGPYFGYWDQVMGTVLATAQLQVGYDDFSVNLGSDSARLGNISTRANVGSGADAAIGGFIVTGTSPKRILIRGLKAQTSGALLGALEDPTLELYGQNGLSLATNDNWKDTQQAEIEQTGLQPSRDLDSAIVTTVAPGAYTAILRGKANTTGLGLVETYDLTQAEGSRLGNFSTRGVVGVGDNVMIGGIIVQGNALAHVLVRAIGPSLQAFGVGHSLADPMLELYDRNGTLLASNDNWRSRQESEIIAAGLAPGSIYESAIVGYLLPANHTAIVRGQDGTTGVALVELYHLD